MEDNIITVNVKPKKKIYYKDNYGIYVCYDLDISDANGDNIEVTILGSMPMLTLKKQYQCKAEVVNHPDYGKQYKITYIYSLEDDSEIDFISKFTTEKTTEYIKQVYEKPVTEILNNTFSYKKVKYLTEKRCNKLKKDILTNVKYMNASSMLSKYNIPFYNIKKIVDRFGSSELAEQQIKSNPYILYQYITGIGFNTCDDIAMNSGISPRSPDRIKAGIKYMLELEEQSGNTWMYIDMLFDKLQDILCIHIDDRENYLGNFYVDGDKIASKKNQRCEQEIADQMNRLNTDIEILTEDQVNKYLNDNQTDIIYSEQQKQLFYSVAKHNIVVLTGFAGSGKCVHGDTYIYTDKGMIKIKDIPKHYEVLNTYCTSNVISYNLNGSKNISKTSNWYDMGISDTIKIKTSQGYEIEGTYEHPIIILDVDGNLKFKKIADITNTDIIAVSKNNNLWGNNFVDLDTAYVMGVLIGDGSLNGINHKHSNYQISYSKTDNYMSSNINGILYEKFPITKIGRTENKRSVEHVFCNKQTHNQLSNLGMCWTTSEYKYIPESILTSKRECVVSFLQGLFDTDASVSIKGIVEYSTASYLLAKQVHLMLLNFGIISRLHIKNVKGKDYYIINITGEFLRQFKHNIGFRFCLHKLNNLNSCLNRNINPNLDVLYYQNNNIKNNIHKQILGKPYYKKHNNNYNIKCKDGVNRSLMHIFDNRGRNCSNYLIKNIIESIDISNPTIDYLYNLSNNIFFDKIQSIEQSKANVYDFTVENMHNFISNGIISHNTTIVKGCLNMINSHVSEYKIMLVSPTAKAAKVLSNSTKREAMTIHRALINHLDKSTDTYNKFDCDMLVVDEASMIDIYLFRNLLSALPDGCKLLMIGDTAQLESIAVGNVLHDVINSKLFSVVSLTEVYRQALGSGILSLATDVRHGKRFYSNKDKTLEIGDNCKVWFGSKDDSTSRVLLFYKSRLKKWKPEDILVISPMKRGKSGVTNLNTEIQKLVNEKFDIEYKGYRIGDKVRHTKNNYGLNVFNGDFGIITNIEDEKITVDYGDKIIEYEDQNIGQLSLAYAITTHSSQGSQSPVVIGVLDISHYLNLKRNLVYTMCTRAQEYLDLVVEPKAIDMALRNNTIIKKQTFLEKFLQSTIEIYNFTIYD